MAESLQSYDEQPEVEIAYMFAETHGGKGLGTEAAKVLMHYGFEELKFPRLICCIEAENLAFIKIMKNLGMILEKEVDTREGLELLFAKSRS